MKLILALTLVLALLAPAAVRAELIPQFDLDGCVGMAAAIVEGQLASNGKLAITRVLYGSIDGSPTVQIPAASYSHEKLLKAINGRDGLVDTVIFLRRARDGWQPIMGDAGIIAFHGDAVYSFGPTNERIRDGAADFAQRNGETRDKFEKSLQSTIAIRSALDAVIAQPRGANRALSLANIVIQRGRARWTSDGLWFVTALSVSALRPVDPAEQAALLKLIAQNPKAEDKAKVVELAGSVPFASTAFGELSTLIDRSQPPVVRRAAMYALAAVDPFAASERLASILTIDEPELATALQSLPTASILDRDRGLDRALPQDGSYRDGILSIKVVNALEGLSDKLAHDNDNVDGNVRYMLLAQMQNYAHPRLIGIVYEWAWNANASIANQALSALQAMTGLKWTREQKAEWSAWWKQAQSVLQAKYDLTTKAGRTAWMSAYSNADPETQALLLRLWHFEEKIDEAELLAPATAPDRSNGALAVLLELWRVERLSCESQRRLFDKYYKTEFVEGETDPTDPTYRNVYIYGTPQITFPHGLDINALCSVVLNEEPKTPRESVSGLVLEGHQRVNLGSLGTGGFHGQPVAKGVIILRQIDYYHGKRELWSIRRELGPINLRNEP